MEMQRGVVGDLTKFPDLVEACERRGVVPNTRLVLDAARIAAVPVIHCTAAFRADRAGSHTANSPFIRHLLKDPGHMLEGAGAVEVLPELDDPAHLRSPRHHGFSPFTGTSLDMLLRSLGVDAVVATGVSVNLGIPGLALEAVNLGYRVAVVTDAVAGVPEDYAEAVLRHTIGLLAARVTAAVLSRVWTEGPHSVEGGSIREHEVTASGEGRVR